MVAGMTLNDVNMKRWGLRSDSLSSYTARDSNHNLWI